MVYERENENILTYGKPYSDKLAIYNKVPSERLYISVLEYFLEDTDKKEIIGDFIEFFSTEFNVFSEILFESSVKKLSKLSGKGFTRLVIKFTAIVKGNTRFGCI